MADVVISEQIKVEREIAGRMMSIETGVVARLASSAVILRYGGSAVLATVVRADAREGLDFFPMQVDYREKLTAAGKFPGGFRKREGPPSEKEILTMRMIDRPIRPLFPDGFIEEIQIQCWVMSHDGENDTDVLASVAASAALAISDAPFEGPIATVRVGRVHTDDGPTLVANPTASQMDYSDLDMVLSGHADGINMIEVGAAEVGEDDMLDAIEFGQGVIDDMLVLIDDLVAEAGQEKRPGNLVLPTDDVIATVEKAAKAKMLKARQIMGKHDRGAAVRELRDEVLEKHFQIVEDGTPGEHITSVKRRAMAKEAFRTLEKKCARQLLVDKGIRADGRDLEELRPIFGQVNYFERTHGSALFQRGETQSIVSCTLGTGKDAQIVDGLMPEYSKKFTLHYNFPPFCVGEARRIMGPGRREIGHGALAERSLLGILPGPDEFPYTVRLVSDITESNGSSSMASICGGCLALMDAGVPILGTCAGISVGRVTDEKGGSETYITDIIGEEDFFGDMDFKVAGTREGITGIQLDLKARGLVIDQIERIFEQAREARIEIIDIMEEVIEAPRDDISKFAPRIETVKINPEKIGKLIGPGGKTIRAIQERWGVQVDVAEDGTVSVASTDAEGLAGAKQEIEALGEEIKVGSIYTGKVVSVRDFGAFIEIAAGTDGMCHISELKDGYVEKVTDVVNVGDEVTVKVILVDDQGRIKLSRKQALPPEERGGDDDDDGERGERGDRGDRGSRGEGRGDRNRDGGGRGGRGGRDRDRDGNRDGNRDGGRDGERRPKRRGGRRPASVE
ncbi:MAG: polyribonucleotide nucleotidyltransferase [Phycisphaera sp.]|nr:MAG: polyribonucleotide nucleotidyltransferase [Phycisphaera sp.]